MVAREIFNQLGGNAFAAMTGSKKFIADGNTLRMSLARNASKANRLYITLDADDTYTMRFFHYTAPRFSKRTFTFTEEKERDIYKTTGIYCDQLREVFTMVTGLYTRF